MKIKFYLKLFSFKTSWFYKNLIWIKKCERVKLLIYIHIPVDWFELIPYNSHKTT